VWSEVPTPAVLLPNAATTSAPPAVLPGLSAPNPAATLLRFQDVVDPAPKATLLYHGMPNAKTASVVAQTKSWQAILKKFGYSLGKTGPAKDGVDGDFGGLTTTATVAFQKQGQLNVDPSIVADGKVGPQTRRLVAYRARLAAAVVSGRARARRYRRSA
jgi:peptidoglycan hydrolase-like protein with peptidoglycan-binding domain